MQAGNASGSRDRVRKQFYRLSLTVFIGVTICVPSVQAKNKQAKVPPSPPKDEIEVVGHIPAVGGPISRFLSTQHYSSYYLYAEHTAGTNVTLIDVTKIGQPAVLADVPFAPGGEPESLLTVAGTAALTNSAPVTQGAAVAPQTLRIMDFSDPQHPKVAREFTGVTAISRNDPRGLIFIANSDGIWILQQHFAEDPAIEKAYSDYILYGSR